MVPAELASTREKILEIAQDLIREHGYSGTSISQIAGRLGTSKAALYYHFKSKEEILDALLAGPMHAFEELARKASVEPAGTSAEYIFSSIIDFIAGPSSCLAAFQNDPSVLQEYAKCNNLQQFEDQILRALAGPRPTTAKLVRAKAALAAAKQGTTAALSMNDGKLTAALRAEILAAALRTLGD